MRGKETGGETESEGKKGVEEKMDKGKRKEM